MRGAVRKTLRVVGSHLQIALVLTALVCAAISQFLMTPPRVLNTASIAPYPTTIGSADSELYNLSQEDVDRTLDTLQAMDVHNVRILIPWALVQPLPNVYDWTNVDRMVEAANKRGMGVLATINSTPKWAGTPYLTGHPDPAVYGAFASEVASRYKGKVAAYEVWNEPNAIFFWDPVDPVAYTDLLKAGYSAIKEADPSAVVIGGVFGAVFSAGPLTKNPQDFLKQMYQSGAKGYFDALSFHPYQYTLKFSDGQDVLASPLRQYEAMRDVMRANGDEDLKIWATEYGLPTTQISPEVNITEEYQASFIENFLNSWQTVENPGPIFIYTTRDTATGDPSEFANFGFFQTDWTPKLAAQVIAEFAGGQVPGTSDHPLLDAAVAFARAVVDITVRVITGLIDLGVRVVKGIADATVAFISGVLERLDNRFGNDSGTTTVEQGQLAPATAQPSAGADSSTATPTTVSSAESTNSRAKATPILGGPKLSTGGQNHGTRGSGNGGEGDATTAVAVKAGSGTADGTSAPKSVNDSPGGSTDGSGAQASTGTKGANAG